MRKPLAALGASVLIVMALSGCGGHSAAATALSTSPPVASAPASAPSPGGSAVAAPGSPALPDPGSAATERPMSTDVALTASSAAAAPESAPPGMVAGLPDGVYRVHLTADELAAGGEDPGNAGTFTLTIKQGGYRLGCAAEPGTSCGNGNSATGAHEDEVEIGQVRGSGDTVWFVQDNARKHKDTGCVLESQDADGCGPDDAYRLSWSVNGNLLSLKDFYGLGDEAGGAEGYQNFTFKPWTRIS